MPKPSADPFLPGAEKQKGKIVSDPELLVMNKINRLIDSLPSVKAKIRVIAWLHAKIESPLTDEVPC